MFKVIAKKIIDHLRRIQGIDAMQECITELIVGLLLCILLPKCHLRQQQHETNDILSSISLCQSDHDVEIFNRKRNI